MQIQAEKAPAPDSYIRAFYKTCWNTIKLDLLAAIKQIGSYIRAFYKTCWNTIKVDLVAAIKQIFVPTQNVFGIG
jgi:uncharacterized protein with HEPN domain